MVCRKAREAVRFLRHNKVCIKRRTTGQCDHPGCQLAVEYGSAVESLIAENESLRSSQPTLIRVAAKALRT